MTSVQLTTLSELNPADVDMLTLVLIGNSSSRAHGGLDGDPAGLPRGITAVIRIGMTGFEPAAPSSRTKCATKLRHIPAGTA